MSRIYDNKPLSALPVSNVNWQKPWNEQEFTRYTKITFEMDGLILTSLINKDLLHYDHFVLSFSEGNGVLLEGTVNKRHRIAITDSQNGKVHI